MSPGSTRHSTPFAKTSCTGFASYKSVANWQAGRHWVSNGRSG